MEKLLTYQEAADELRISSATLRVWVSAGRVPYTKLGKCVRFSESQLLDIINGGKHEAVTVA